MRILHVTTHMNMGGIANYVFSLAKALKRKGVVSIIASSGGDLEAELKRCGIAHEPLDIKTKFEFSPKVFRSVSRIARIIKDERIDVIHAHTRVSQVASYFAARKTGVPYVTTCHGFFKRRLGRRLFDFWGDKTIAISGPVRDSLINDFGMKAERIELIHTGVDIDRFSKEYSNQELSSFKKELGLEGACLVGTIGRLSSVKGHKFFIEAVGNVLAKGYAVKGFIVGNGPEEAALKRGVKSLGIEGSFRFFASTPDTSKYLAIMDIFVFPSVKEGLGLSLLEAMASGRPCIASEIGGISDIVRNGENGILFDVGDVQDLSDSIIRLLRDSGLRQRLGASAKSHVQKGFSLDGMADKALGLYRRISDSHAAG